MNCRDAAIIFLVVSSCLTIVLVLYFIFNGKCAAAKYEGFLDSAPMKSDAIKTTMKIVKRLSAIVTDRHEWSDRFSMMNMTPTELARRYLKSATKKE